MENLGCHCELQTITISIGKNVLIKSAMIYSSIAAAALIVLHSICAAEGQCSAGKGCFSNQYDNVNVDNVLTSDRLLKRYVDCLMDRGACTREGLFLKEVIPDALQTECSKCNDHQKAQAGKIISHMLQNKRPWFDELVEKYDQTGLYRKKYEYEEDGDYDDEEEEKTSKKESTL